VSPVTYPAYPDASAALRCIEQMRAAPPVPDQFPITGAQAARLGLTIK
jgi:hypothetical protein